MAFGRKFANRVLLAYVVPLAFLLVVGTTVAYFAHFNIGRVALGEIVVIIPAILIGRLLTRRDAQRFAQLRRSAEQIERGDYHGRLLVSDDNDEYADLARAFNHMADVLAARENALREQNHNLIAVTQRMESVLNATNDGIALLTREGKFALVNRRFCQMLGTAPERVLHQTLADVQPHLLESLSKPERLMTHMAALTLDDLSDPIGVAEEVIELSQPDKRFVQVYTAPVRGEDHTEVIGRIIALRDVTRERELDKMKTEFISVVSHELRTPMTSIKGYTDLLLSGAADGSDDLMREFLGIIQSSTTRLSNLINDILDISRIESGKIDIKREPIDYPQIVTDTLRLMRAAADAKHIEMEARLPEWMPTVSGDCDKVMQVLTNLIGNALKYTPAGGKVRVWLEVSEGIVTTCVQDSGIGIAIDDQKKLFQKFFRADNSSTREAGGTGLGLVIAKTIVELLGGAIWVESEPNEGSRFYFTLPLSQTLTETPEPGTTPLPERGISLVLLVNSDGGVRGLLQHFLHRRGYGTIGADNSADALQKARQHKPDAIVMDMMMPEMDSFHTLRALKSDPATASIPVVAVSLAGDGESGGVSLATFSFVPKPASVSAMAELIADAGGTTILFIGDNRGEDEITALQTLLTGQKTHLLCAETVTEALTLAITRRPDCIFLDMTLPDDTLFAFLNALKNEKEAARIPLVLLTRDISGAAIHFHRGTFADTGALPLEYLGEQLETLLTEPVSAR